MAGKEKENMKRKGKQRENTSRKVWHTYMHTYQHTYTPSRGPSLDNQRSAQVQPHPCKLTAVPSTAYYGKHGYFINVLVAEEQIFKARV